MKVLKQEIENAKKYNQYLKKESESNSKKGESIVIYRKYLVILWWTQTNKWLSCRNQEGYIRQVKKNKGTRSWEK